MSGKTAASKVAKCLVCAAIMAGVVPAATTQTVTAGANSTVSAGVSTPLQRIAEAISSAGIAVQEGQIEMLSGAKLGAAASLHVVKVANAAAGPNAGGTITARTIQVRLRCQDNHECLPFYVLVHGIDDPKALGAEPKALRALAQAAMPATVRGGDHAILILETADSRLSFPVICLQSGNRGQKVRVSSPDHARFYDAEVVAAGLLKGSL